MSTQLDRLARRVMQDAFFLAAPLARFAESQQMNDDTLAKYLGCDVGTLIHLRLCRNPDPDPPHFWGDVERIAARFQVDSDTLAELQAIEDLLTGTEVERRQGLDRLHQLLRRLRH